MLETIGIFIAIIVIFLVIKNKLDCNRCDRNTEEELQKKRKSRQDLLAKALERSIQ